MSAWLSKEGQRSTSDEKCHSSALVTSEATEHVALCHGVVGGVCQSACWAAAAVLALQVKVVAAVARRTTVNLTSGGNACVWYTCIGYICIGYMHIERMCIRCTYIGRVHHVHRYTIVHSVHVHRSCA